MLESLSFAFLFFFYWKQYYTQQNLCLKQSLSTQWNLMSQVLDWLAVFCLCLCMMADILSLWLLHQYSTIHASSLCPGNHTHQLCFSFLFIFPFLALNMVHCISPLFVVVVVVVFLFFYFLFFFYQFVNCGSAKKDQVKVLIQLVF